MNLTQAIKSQIIMLASFTGRDMNEMLLAGYMEAISDLDEQQVLDTLKTWMRTNKGFPHPADIREKIMPELHPEDDAQDVASLILSGIGRYGYTNAERARIYIGELGWATVNRMGGWKHLCESVTIQNENSYRAQIRDLAQTVRRRAMRGELDQAPALPAPQDAIKKLITDTFNKPEEL